MSLRVAAAFAVAVATGSATDEALPRVLILGDSIYAQPAGEVSKALAGRVEVVCPRVQPGEVRTTTAVLENLEDLLGEVQWDLIHFNLGLGDLIYRAPGMESFRVFPKGAGGVRATGPERYEANLRKLVKRLQATGARLVWASTTPIRHSASDVFEKGSEIEYNAIAARVMKEHGVPTNDMYHYVLELIDMDKPASHGADPFFFDRKPLHPPVEEAILKHLPAGTGSPEVRECTQDR